MTFPVESEAFVAGSKVIFACSMCGATFQALQRRRFDVQPDSFRCLICDNIVHRWAGAYDYLDWHPT
jgi:hypothetical protein